MSYKQLFKASSLAACLSLVLVPFSGALAAEYGTVLPDESTIQFGYQQMGVNMNGKFTRFEGDLSFDPGNPEDGQASFQVDLSSVDTGTSDGNDEVVGKDWFNVDAHPTASFESDKISVTGEGQYDVSGVLTIKGIEQDVTVPAVFHEEAGKGIFEAEFVIQRGDYSIGEGSWSTFDIVANEVTINVQIAAEAN
ncbi:MAG TPA: YceI family protein [Burkholderiaceae bacterium]|nr:YceI family protein [Burkholderiaceae bacterium]